ncbi:hypothetical protein BCT11_18985 [Vibrio sp. 10N.222.52.B12]|nr:hypothetical protein BCT11_18985 [Vibrio sp. 10N.222.52.B12]
MPAPNKVIGTETKARIYVKDKGFGHTSFSQPSSFDVHQAKFEKTYIVTSCPYCVTHKQGLTPIQIAHHVHSFHADKWQEFSEKYQFLKDYQTCEGCGALVKNQRKHSKKCKF